MPDVNPPLGRWNIHNYSETTLKVKYANEDNCGASCHNYQKTTQIQQNNRSDEHNEYVYMMGYESVH